MPRGDKSTYTAKQKRQAEHIEEGYRQSGTSEKEAEARAWATVNKTTGGGKKSGPARSQDQASGSAKKGTRTAAERSASAKKAAQTRARNAANKRET